MDSLELFCGTGGLALGLHNAGFHHKALFEWDHDSCNNINSNIQHFSGAEAEVIEADVRDIDFSIYQNQVVLVSGGPPCQPFSLGGKHKAYNDSRDMFPQAVRAVREIQPKAFIFENVKGLLRTSFSEYYSYIILQLCFPSIEKENGQEWRDHKAVLEEHKKTHKPEYNVQYKLLNAADYGVPQIRHRVFIVGFRADIKQNWQFPAPTHSKEALLYSQWVTGDYWKKYGLQKPTEPQVSLFLPKEKPALKPWVTVRDAIHDLPDPRKKTDIPDHDYRDGARSYPGHTGSPLDQPSKTIKAGAHGVPGGENTVIIDGLTRYYTVRESARIQTFPDSYVFNSSWTESMRQIGNAVPVKLAEAVGRSVYAELRRLEQHERRNTDYKTV